jgi:CelD/BcsL family acetyltransferase involved in cellulose biosynthesis
MRQRQLTLLGNGISDRLDILAAPMEAQAVAAAAFHHIERSQAMWDVCDFRDVPGHSPLLATPLSVGKEDVIEPEEPCPAVRLRPGRATVVDGLPPTRRHDLRRCARGLCKLGIVEFSCASPHNRQLYLAELFRLHQARWHGRTGIGVLQGQRLLRFHEMVTSELIRKNMVRLHLLALDGQAIAAHYELRTRDNAFSYIHGFDPNFASWSPGRILLAHVLEQARREGIRQFDLLRGRETYKYEWGAKDRVQFRRRVRK